MGLRLQMVVASGSRFLPARREGITDMDKEIRYFVNGYEMLLYMSGDREERAFELAKHDYYGFLDYKEDRYTTVYGYMD